MASGTSQNSRLWIGIVLVVAIVVGVVSYSRSHSAVEVRTALVTRRDIVSTISTNGKVEPLEDFEAHAPQPGIVKALYVKLGDQVHAGQELVRMDVSDASSKIAQSDAQIAAATQTLRNMQQGGSSAELSSNKSDLITAEQQAQAAASQLNTMEALQAKGSASAQEVASARDKVSETSARVAALKSVNSTRYTTGDIKAQQALVAANVSARHAATEALSNVDIRAPFAGTVYKVSVKASEYVPGAEEAMVSVADMTRLQVRLFFDEPEIGKLAAGQAVKIVWDARPDHVWHGHVTQPPTTVITYNGTRNVGEALVSIDDARGDLLPNTNVTGTVTISQHNDTLSLPREALHTLGKEDFVYRIVDSKLVKTPVKVGVLNQTSMEIVSGLHEGDKVALGGVQVSQMLTDGLKVKSE